MGTKTFTNLIPNSPHQYLSSFLLLLLPIILFLLQKKLKMMKPKHKTPPGPFGLPIIGSLHQIGHVPHLSLAKLSQKHGPVMLLNLGSIPTLVISNAEFAKEVLQTHDAYFCSRPLSPGPKKLSYDFKGIALAPASDYRTEIRKLFSFELLKAKREQSVWAAREDQMDKMLTGISNSIGAPVNLNDHVFPMVDGVIGQVAFGKSYGATQFNGQKFSDVLDEVMNMLESFTAEDFFPTVGKYIDLLKGHTARLDKSFKDLDGYLSMVLGEHLDPNRPTPDAEDLVDVLIKFMKDSEGKIKITKDHVKSVLMDTFVGGVDTTSVGTIWAMSEIFMSPRILKKAQVEVRAAVGRKPCVKESDLPNLPYIKMIVKEMLRMHPPAPLLIPREVMRQCTIGKEGYTIFPKTRVLVNAWAIGRDENSWDKPNVFMPERFENSEIDLKGAHFQLIPFGSGRRICPGMSMGLTSITFIVANLLFGFDWSLPDGMKREDICMEEDGGLTMHKKTPLVLKATKYDWQCA